MYMRVCRVSIFQSRHTYINAHTFYGLIKYMGFMGGRVGKKKV